LGRDMGKNGRSMDRKDENVIVQKIGEHRNIELFKRKETKWQFYR
jgi:hypothetical protein